MILRSTGWEGLAPAAGDVVRMPTGELHVVTGVVMGAGVGHWILDVEKTPRREITWTPEP